MCLDVGEIGDCMVDAMYKEQGYGWSSERQSTV